MIINLILCYTKCMVTRLSPTLFRRRDFIVASIKKNAKTNKWEFVFDRYVDGKRKQVRRRGFDTKREAIDKLAELKMEVIEGYFIDPSHLTLEQFLEEWRRGAESRTEETTFYNRGLYIKNHILPYFKDTKLQDIDLRMSQNFIDKMSSDGYAFNTIENVRTTVVLALDSAVEYKLIKENPMRLAKLPKRDAKEMKVWTVEQVNHFLNYTKDNSKFHCVYALALMTGMRQGEILGLRWQDIDFEKKMLYVRQTLTHYGKSFKKGAKTKSGVRSIAISDNLIKILKEEKEKVEYKKKRALDEWIELDLVICALNGNRVFPSNLTKFFKKDIINAGVPDIRFHDMRHTHATMLMEQNVNVKVVSERLGHSRISITLDTYSHVLPNMQRDVATNIDEIIQI